MPREWHFDARSPGSRSSCASADPSRLPASATEAFVDRAAIDWTALLARARPGADCAFVETLRHLDAIRTPTSRVSPGAPGAILRAVVAGVAAIQAAACFLALASASVSGLDVGGRAVPLAIAVAFAGSSAFLALRARHDPNAACLLGAFATAASAFARAAARPLPSDLAPSAMLLAGIYPEAFAPALIWDLAVSFPRVSRFARFDVMARRASIGAWIGGGVLFAANAAAAYGPAVPRFTMLMRNDARNLFWHLFVIGLVPAVAAIFVRSRRAPAPERRRVERFAVAIGLGTGPLLLSGLARMALPPFDAWMAQSGGWARGAVDAVILGALVALPIACTIAILKDRPFELAPARKRRDTVAGLAAFGGSAVLAITWSAPGSSVQYDPGRTAFWMSLLAAAVILGPILLWTNRLRIPRLRREQRLAGAVDRMARARGPRELIAVLERELTHAAGVTAAHVLVPAGSGDTLADPCGRVDALSGSSALLAMLAATGGDPLDVTDRALESLLPSADLEWIRRSQAALLTAINGPETDIAAVVVLGSSGAAPGFVGIDRWFVKILTGVAAGLLSAANWAVPPRSAAGAAIDSREDIVDLAYECRDCGAIAATSALPCGCGVPYQLAALPMQVGARFALVRRVGAGALGVVYLAHDRRLGRDVALKTLPAVRGPAVTRLATEARAMARLNHAGIATLFDLHWWRATPVLVTEYFPDGTLADLLRTGPLSCGAVVALGVAIARTLAYMHAQGTLHGDIKPTNIAMAATGCPTLLDLGLAAAIDPEPPIGRVGRRRRKRWAGTPAYLPPEAFRGVPRTAAFDLWALSIVLAEALTGVAPRLSGGSVRLEMPDGVSHRALLPFFQRALAVDPGRRFGSARELAQALQGFADAARFV